MRVLVTGASSQIGKFLMPRLHFEGHAVFAVSRLLRDQRDGITPGAADVNWLLDDIEAPRLPWPAVDALIHIAPLHLLPSILPDFMAKGGRRVVCFGTTSRHSKATSADPKERAFAAAQIAAEREVAELCESAGVAWTLFRPTLIYGAGMDRNVTMIARLIRRFGIFPLLGDASGRRQPIHADDLAAACVGVLAKPRTYNSAYDLTGGETLTYREMVERIFLAERKRPRFLPIPLAAFRACMWCVSRLPRFRDFNAEMARRMNADLVFDSAPAVRDFGFSPRRFSPDPLPLDSVAR